VKKKEEPVVPESRVGLGLALVINFGARRVIDGLHRVVNGL
jgi:hypothetical protein